MVTPEPKVPTMKHTFVVVIVVAAPHCYARTGGGVRDSSKGESNAGVDLRGGALGEAFSQPMTWAVISGLVIGKIIGIGGVTYLLRRLRWGTLPADMHHREIVGVAALGGIGFTVSLFITDLAFTDAALIGQAKVGILAASTIAAVAGTVLLLSAPAGTAATPLSPTNDDRPGS